MNVDEPSSDRIGSTLRDKWVLEELLGIGGMASVYAARHKIGRRDAIKILHPKVARSEQLRARFEQEAHAVNAFRHPGVVEIRDVDTAEDGAPFLVMELLEGESLAQHLARRHSMEALEVLAIAASVLDVLAAAHARGIIHRDIKPDNLFLTNDGHVKVLDFGIARVRSADRKALTTKAGVTLGTMAYMAPEQARGEEIDGRADVYAVGATIFRSLAGRVVHDADSQASLVMRVIAHGAPRLSTIVRDVSPDIGDVVDRALAFELEDRYPDAATMLSDVRAVLDGKTPPYAHAAPPIPERPRISSLFDESSSEVKGKPTVVPAARQQQRAAGLTAPTLVGRGGLAEAAPSVAPLTRVASGDIPVAALRSVEPGSAPTRISREESPSSAVVSGRSMSERVVIMPSRQGNAVFMPSTSQSVGSTSDVATVHGFAPPPVVSMPDVRRGPARTDAVLTPFGELSALMRRSPSTTILAIAGGVAVLALLLLMVTIVWVVDGATTRSAEEPSVAPSATATATSERAEVPAAPMPPPARRSRR